MRCRLTDRSETSTFSEAFLLCRVRGIRCCLRGVCVNWLCKLCEMNEFKVKYGDTFVWRKSRKSHWKQFKGIRFRSNWFFWRKNILLRSLQSWFESIFTTLFSHPKNMNRILPPISIKPSTVRAYDSSALAGKNFSWEPWFSHRFFDWTIIRYRYNKTHFKRFQKRIINIYLTSAEDKNLKYSLRI